MYVLDSKFKQLIEAESEDEIKKLEKFFLEKTKEALESDFKANALEVAAEFDEFRRVARDEEGMPFYQVAQSSEKSCVKRHHEP